MRGTTTLDRRRVTHRGAGPRSRMRTSPPAGKIIRQEATTALHEALSVVVPLLAILGLLLLLGRAGHSDVQQECRDAVHWGTDAVTLETCNSLSERN